MEKNNLYKTHIQQIREQILKEKEFFLLNFVSDVPREEDTLRVLNEFGEWEGCEMDFCGDEFLGSKA